MPKPKLIRGLTLLLFLSFITAFVLYRSGKFDRYLAGAESDIQSSPNGGSMATVPIDTIPRFIKDSTQKTILSSSKYLYPTITPRLHVKPVETKYDLFDSVKMTELIRSMDKTPQKRKILWSGSKSGHIIYEDDILFMSSSKSTQVFSAPRKKLEPPILKYNRDSLRLRLTQDSVKNSKQ